MSPKKPRNSTRQRPPHAGGVRPKTRPAQRRKPTLSPAAMKKRLQGRKPVAGLGTAAVDALRGVRDGGPADDREEDRYAILDELVRAISVIRTAKQSLEHAESAWDEITTLEAAIEMLRLVDMALNDVADGRPSRIRPDETEDEADDEEVGHD